MNLNYDLPISDITEDKLNREALVGRLCEITCSITSNAAFVVGLSGKWGSGKTSILNMASKRIEASGKAHVVRFNPWMVSNQEQMIRVFFGELMAGISKNGKNTNGSTNEITQMLTEYYEALEPYCSTVLAAAGSSIAPMPIAAAGSKFATTSVRRFLNKVSKKTDKSKKSLSELKKEICDLLTKQFANTVVLIDDIDRLDNEEIRQIFKLVNLSASFPRVVYVLAYDADVVDRALFGVQNIKGRDYLEKIVQVEMRVPEISGQDVLRYLSEGIERIVDDFELEEIRTEAERERFLRIFDAIVLPVFLTPRRIARFLNLFRINVARSVGQICATDLVAMTVIQMFYPDTLEWIKANKEEICGSRFRYLAKGEIATDLAESLEAAAIGDAIPYRLLFEAITSIFPRLVRLITGEPSYNTLSAEAAKAKGRVCSIQLLDLFFTEQSQSSFTRGQLHNILSSGSREDIDELIRDAINYKEFNGLMHFAQEEAHSLPKAQVAIISKGLIRSFGKAKEIEHAFLTNRESDELLGKTLRVLFDILGPEISSDIVLETIPEFDWCDYAGMTLFVRDERLAQVEEGDGRSPSITPQCYASLSSKYTETILEYAKKILENGDVKPITMARAIAEDNQLSNWQAFEDRVANDVEMNVLYCADRLTQKHGERGISFTLELTNIDIEKAVVESVLRPDFLDSLTMVALVRLAALYMLLQNPDAEEIEEADAIKMVETWMNRAEE